MKRLVLTVVIAVFCLLLFAGNVSAQVVRLLAHGSGASGTVVHSTDSKSYILTVAHAFPDGSPPYAAVTAGLDLRWHIATLVAIDRNRDLALLTVDAGPFPTFPVAAAGHKAARLRSSGHDRGGPRVDVAAAVRHADAQWTWTNERSVHGRSGVALYDPDGRVLVGVVSGNVTSGQLNGCGVYVGLASVRAFVEGKLP